jgi:hypothetical protein
MLHVIVPLVDSYRAAHPQVTLELHSNEGITDLIEHRTDVVRIGTLRDSTLHARPLGSSRIRVLASPDYLARCGTPRRLQDLAGTPCWASPSRRRSTTGRCARPRAHRCASPAIASSSGETLRQLALAGAGIVCLSDFMTRRTAAAAGWCRCSCGRAWTSARPSTRSITATPPCPHASPASWTMWSSAWARGPSRLSRRHGAARPVQRSSTVHSASGSKGLATKSFMPASRQRWRSSAITLALMAMMGRRAAP